MTRDSGRIKWLWALVAVGLLGVPGLSVLAEVATAGFTLVPEMEPLEDVVAQPRRAREALQGRAAARRGLQLFEARVAAEWPSFREIDLVALSRFHVEQTEGFELPAAPGEFAGRAIAYDEASGQWTLELRGPRLPARYDIVHRYLHVFTTFDEATGELGRLTVTIRGWVLE